MEFNVEVVVELKPDILDPQGKTINKAVSQFGFSAVKSVRVGKSIKLKIDADSKEKAIELATELSNKLLANPVMEVFMVRVDE